MREQTRRSKGRSEDNVRMEAQAAVRLMEGEEREDQHKKNEERELITLKP